jgi:hypothetical protein
VRVVDKCLQISRGVDVDMMDWARHEAGRLWKILTNNGTFTENSDSCSDSVKCWTWLLGLRSFKSVKTIYLIFCTLIRRREKINIETRRSTTPGKRVILVQGPC